MSIGFVLHREGEVERVGKRLPGKGTNNIAEWTALLEGLRLAKARGCRELEVIGDSELVIKQMRGEYRVRKEHLKPLFEEVRALVTGFDRCEFRWVPREQNGEANDLAQGALGV